MILLRFLSRAHLQGGMSPLELTLYHHVKNIIGFQPEWFEFLLWVDADTEVFPDSINRMVSCFVSDGRMVGLCGETLIKNEGDSWVTMIQVYEYFISHHLAKAFESLFGSVTCLPGCFSMYRIKSSSKEEPIMIHKNLVEGYGVNKVDTLHMKNLLTLGEDRWVYLGKLTMYSNRTMIM
jgi:chitin synthase